MLTTRHYVHQTMRPRMKDMWNRGQTDIQQEAPVLHMQIGVRVRYDNVACLSGRDECSSCWLVCKWSHQCLHRQ